MLVTKRRKEQKMRYRLALTRTAGVALAVTMTTSTLLGCGGGESLNVQDTPPSVRPANYTGRELYEGMFFGTGRAAGLFPEIWNNEQVQAEIRSSPRKLEFDKVALLVSAQVGKQDPSFFQRFEAALQSRDHVLIAQALTEARQNTEQAARALKETSQNQVNGMYISSELDTSVAVEIVLLFDMVVAVYRAAVLVAAVFWVQDGPANDALTLDRLVDTLAHKDFTPAAL